MKVLSADNPATLREAVDILKRGGVIVFPTETAYGLGGDWTKPAVHARIRKIKGRPENKPFPVVAASRAQAARYVKFNASARQLAAEYWPGPLSLVLPLRRARGTLSIRVSPHAFVMGLVRRLGLPLIATSANVSGSKTLYCVQDIMREFKRRKHRPDLVVDAGALPKRPPSTIIAIKEDGSLELLRDGPIKISKFRAQISKPHFRTEAAFKF